MSKERVKVYFDGFNMYHALHALRENHLKWVNLHKLSKRLLRPRTQTLDGVVYCSALANHFTGTKDHNKLARHIAYRNALEAKGVDCRMGKFAKRDLFFTRHNYRAKWKRREEKQTDVRIAISLVEDAYENEFDTALIVSCDSDLVPSFEAVKRRFPEKRLVTVAPPGRKHNDELLALADYHLSVKTKQVRECLFGARIMRNKSIVAVRPPEYRP
ncbi:MULTISPECIES: NYN domain-containing protein [Roseovarius]|uniref:NYN domain-containing protein n=1 Tax=Roseovarius TaxID=74030 RepID=UPI00273F6110|nr:MULTISPECIES: NYN domain-containing protein [unclassified Roseovarius]